MPARDWPSLLVSHPTGAAVALAIAVLALLGARLALRRTRLHRRLDGALTLLLLGTLAAGLAARGPADDVVFRYARAVAAAAFAIGFVRIALVLFVDFYLRERHGRSVSAIFRDIVGLLAYFLIILVVLRAVLDINLASLIATSAVLTAIVGLSLQDALSSLVSGVVLELEEPFNTADWVRVGAFEGQVVEIGWRTTRLRTRVNEIVVLPNIYLAREPLVNYSRPDPRYFDSLSFEAPYETPPNAVKAAVLEVLRAEPAVLAVPEPEIQTAAFNASGIEYHARYWLDDFANLVRLRDRLLTNIWYALGRAGIRIPFPVRDVFLHGVASSSDEPSRDIAAGLARAPLLGPLTDDERHALAAHARRLLFARGEAIVREGEPGDSFYLIERGDVAVRIGDGSAGGGRVIDRMSAGDCFGEMSLLAGEPRSATIVGESDAAVIEVDRAAFEKILVANPALLEPISQLAIHRTAQQRERRAETPLPPFAEDARAQDLLHRIRAFFGL